MDQLYDAHGGDVRRDLGYRPLVYFWVAEHSDGSALPQFDPETGRENRFGDIDFSRLRRFGGYPFTTYIAEKILEADGMYVVPTDNQPHIIELQEGDKLLAKRENTVKLHTKSGAVERAETVYVLGVEGDKILRIREDGTLEL